MGRIKDHARGLAHARVDAGGSAIGPRAHRRIPLPQFPIVPLTAQARPDQAAEHDQDIAGLVKGGRLQVARVGDRRGADAGPGGFLSRGHSAQGRAGGLDARAVPGIAVTASRK